MTMWAHTHITLFLQACTIRSFHPCHNQLQINIAKMKLALTSRVASALTTPKSNLAEGSFDCTALYNSTQKLAVIYTGACLSKLVSHAGILPTAAQCTCVGPYGTPHTS